MEERGKEKGGGRGRYLVDLAHDVGNGVHGVQGLVGVDVASRVGVAGHLPAAAVDGLQTSAHLQGQKWEYWSIRHPTITLEDFTALSARNLCKVETSKALS